MRHRPRLSPDDGAWLTCTEWSVLAVLAILSAPVTFLMLPGWDVLLYIFNGSDEFDSEEKHN